MTSGKANAAAGSVVGKGCEVGGQLDFWRPPFVCSCWLRPLRQHGLPLGLKLPRGTEVHEQSSLRGAKDRGKGGKPGCALMYEDAEEGLCGTTKDRQMGKVKLVPPTSPTMTQRQR